MPKPRMFSSNYRFSKIKETVRWALIEYHHWLFHGGEEGPKSVPVTRLTPEEIDAVHSLLRRQGRNTVNVPVKPMGVRIVE